MDIAKLHPTAEVEYELDIPNRQTEKIKFTVRFISLDEIPDHIQKGEAPKLSKILRETLIGAVIGWDLTEDGKPLECNEENKRRVLPFLLGLRIKKDDAPENAEMLDSVLGWALSTFAGDAGNFLKN